MLINLFFKLIIYSETVKLNGEGLYNLNDVKYIEVTESFLGLDQEISGCQNEELREDCKTRHYIAALMTQCKCLPLGILTNNEVFIRHYDILISFS